MCLCPVETKSVCFDSAVPQFITVFFFSRGPPSPKADEIIEQMNGEVSKKLPEQLLRVTVGVAFSNGRSLAESANGLTAPATP